MHTLGAGWRWRGAQSWPFLSACSLCARHLPECTAYASLVTAPLVKDLWLPPFLQQGRSARRRGVPGFEPRQSKAAFLTKKYFVSTV